MEINGITNHAIERFKERIARPLGIDFGLRQLVLKKDKKKERIDFQLLLFIK